MKTTSISIGQQSWAKDALISGERLGALAQYFLRLGMIEQVSLKRVDQLEDGGSARAA